MNSLRWSFSKFRILRVPNCRLFSEDKTSMTIDLSDQGEVIDLTRPRNWSKVTLKEFKKSFYKPQIKRTQEEVDNFRMKNRVSILRGKAIVNVNELSLLYIFIVGQHIIPDPAMHFDEVGFPDEVLQTLNVRNKSINNLQHNI